MTVEFDMPTVALMEEHIRFLLRTMGISAISVSCTVIEGDSLRVVVEAGEEGKLLIGVHGTHLLALQHVVRCLLRRHLGNDVRVLVDVNGYRARRERSLLDLAEEMARRAQRTGHSVVLRPMSASDRRTIHTALAHDKDVTTESLGDEPNRRVVVRPIFL